MSFTVLHKKKDGTVVPIKMSIFDAFRGVPDPKPRKPKPCSCCGKIHGHTGDNKDGKGDDNKTKGIGKKDDHGELTEDDQTLLRMKGENEGTPWQDILAATSFKDKSEASARWKEIKHRHDDSAHSNKANEGKKREKDPEKEARAEIAREEGLKKKTEMEAAEKAKRDEGDKPDEENDDKIETDRKKDKESKAKTSKAEPTDLKTWANDYDKKKWQMIASKHYDKTGERITPAHARKVAEGK